ncbi:MAG: EthD domain-containing protein [Holophagales bacterium]|jgi:hypothetical protein|nr:EthD domain-containing protein [Holophagales bacterium]
MIKWTITSRHKPGMTTERFYYEWSVLHVALMLTNASTMRTFRRYTQHFAILGVPREVRLLPQHEMAWESFAEHWIDQPEDILPSIQNEDYLGRMRPHSFSDAAMELQLLAGETVFQREGFRSGGVKVIHTLKRPEGTTQDAFEAGWAGRHGPAVVSALGDKGLRKYVLDRPLRLESEQFKTSLFAHGKVGQYAGTEELWFDDLESAARMGTDPEVRAVLGASLASLVDVPRSHSMYVIERVVFDFVTDGEAMPRPAILDPSSAEARVSGGDWMVTAPALAGWPVPAETGER